MGNYGILKKVMLIMMGWAMISKERVRHMTKLAVFEEREGKEYRKMTQYFRRDYVGLEMLKSFLAGTVLFLAVLGVWAVCEMDFLMENINEMDLIAFGTDILIKYLIFIAVYLLITYIVYNMRYTKGRKRIRLFYNRLKKVSRLYESEGRQNSLEDLD